MLSQAFPPPFLPRNPVTVASRAAMILPGNLWSDIFHQSEERDTMKVRYGYPHSPRSQLVS